jgi:DNA-binding XRE family transcriptional regulator
MVLDRQLRENLRMSLSPARTAVQPKLIADPDVCKAMGCYVRSARNALSLSQHTFSALLGVNRTTLLRLEKGSCPLRTALCVSALQVLSRLGARSDLIERVLLERGQAVEVIDLLIDFASMKRSQEVADSPESEAERVLGLLGQAYVPPLVAHPLRKK